MEHPTRHNPERFTDQWREIPRDTDIATLTDKLTAASIPLHEWAQGSAKTLAHLLKEVNEGESQLSIGSNGEMRRQVTVVGMDVLHTDAQGNVYILREDRQEFADGRTRQRNLLNSLGEKMQTGEDPVAAAERALLEELGIREVTGLYHLGDEETTHSPSSYPGLQSHYKTHGFAAVIPAESFVADGYIEEQADKTNYYVWDLLHAGAGNSA
jgi:hypothetical protein